MKQLNRAPAVIGHINGRKIYEVRGGADDDTATKNAPATMETVKNHFEKAFADHHKKLEEKFHKYENDIKNLGAVSEETKADLRKMAEDYKDILKDFEGVKTDVTGLLEKAGPLGGGKQYKTPGREFLESDQFKSYMGGTTQKASKKYDSNVFMKNTITGLGGSPADNTNDIVPLDTMAGIVAGGFRMLRFLDVVPMGRTSSNQVHFTRENTFTNQAAETQENASKPESTLTFESVDVPVRTIAHWLKVSKQVLDDAPALETYIDRRMRHGVRQRLESQIIAGNGNAPNIHGLLGTDGTTYTDLTIVSGELRFDYINRAKYKVIENEYMPDIVLLNPADWGNMERVKVNSGTDDRYIAGSASHGAIGYLQNGLVPTLWGLPVILSNAMTSGEALVLSLDAIMMWMREEATVEIFEQDDKNVQSNLLTIRGEMRAAFTVFRPTAVQGGTMPS